MASEVTVPSLKNSTLANNIIFAVSTKSNFADLYYHCEKPSHEVSQHIQSYLLLKITVFASFIA